MGEPTRGNRLGAYALGAVGLLTSIVKLVLFVRHLVGTPEDELFNVRNDLERVKETFSDADWFKNIKHHIFK